MRKIIVGTCRYITRWKIGMARALYVLFMKPEQMSAQEITVEETFTYAAIQITNNSTSIMSDLDEIKNHLRSIGKRALERDTIKHRPLICYALHPDVMSEEEYMKLSDHLKDSVSSLVIKSRESDYSSSEEYCTGLFVLLIRIFFEESDGKKLEEDVWHMSNVQRGVLVEWVSKTPWGNDPYTPGRDLKGNSWYNWLRFQCWAIRAEGVGSKGLRIRDNRRVYNQMGFSRSEWRSLIEEEDLGISSDDVNPPGLGDYHMKEYLMSLCAIAQDKKKEPFPDELREESWSWLEPLWGIAPVDDKERISAEWVLVKRLNTFYVELDVKAHGIDYQIVQDNHDVSEVDASPFTDAELYANGGKSPIDTIAPISTEDGVALFKSNNSQMDRVEYKRLKAGAYPAGVYVVHKRDDKPVIAVSSKGIESPMACECKVPCRPTYICGSNEKYVCSYYALPKWESREKIPAEFELVVNGRILKGMTLKALPRLDVRNEIEGARLSVNGDKKRRHVVQSDSDEQPCPVYVDVFGGIQVPKTRVIAEDEIALESTADGVLLRIPQRACEKDIKIELYANLDERTKKSDNIFVLPANWRTLWKRAETWYEEIEENYREKWVKDRMELSCPLMHVAWWWLINDERVFESQNMLIDDLYARLCVYSAEPYHIEIEIDKELYKDKSDGFEQRQEIHAFDLLAYVDRVMQQLGKERGYVELCLCSAGERIVVLSGSYVPLYKIELDKGLITSRVWEDDIQLIIRHEADYFHADDTFRKVVPYDELKEHIQGNILRIPASFYEGEGWESGGVVELSISNHVAYKNVSAKSTLEDRWIEHRPLLIKIYDIKDSNPLKRVLDHMREHNPVTGEMFKTLLPKWAEHSLEWVERYIQGGNKLLLMKNGFFRHHRCKSEYAPLPPDSKQNYASSSKKCWGYRVCWCEFARSDGSSNKKETQEKQKHLKSYGCEEIGDAVHEMVSLLIEWVPSESENNSQGMPNYRHLIGKYLTGTAFSRLNKIIESLEKETQGASILTFLYSALIIMLVRKNASAEIEQSTMRSLFDNLPSTGMPCDAIGRMCNFLAYLKYNNID